MKEPKFPPFSACNDRGSRIIGDRQIYRAYVSLCVDKIWAIMASKELAENRQKRERFDEFCQALNLDDQTSEETWRSYQRISVNYTLEVSIPTTSWNVF